MAANTLVISAESTEALPGSNVTVKLNASSNPGMSVGKLKIGFDSTMLVPVSVKKGSALNKAMYFTSNLDDQNIDPTEIDSITVTWMNMSDISDNGELAEIEFTVKENAVGSAEISVEISELANAASKDITAESVNGRINFSNSGSGSQEEAVIGFSTAAITRTNDRISGSIDISAYSDSARDALFIYTIYDDAGKLISAQTKRAKISAGANEVQLGTVNAKAENDHTYYVKVYMWDELNNLKPIASSITKACD